MDSLSLQRQIRLPLRLLVWSSQQGEQAPGSQKAPWNQSGSINAFALTTRNAAPRSVLCLPPRVDPKHHEPGPGSFADAAEPRGGYGGSYLPNPAANTGPRCTPSRNCNRSRTRSRLRVWLVVMDVVRNPQLMVIPSDSELQTLGEVPGGIPTITPLLHRASSPSCKQLPGDICNCPHQHVEDVRGGTLRIRWGHLPSPRPDGRTGRDVRRSKQVQVLLVWPRYWLVQTPGFPTKPGSLPDPSARGAGLTRSAPALPVRPNPTSPCQNPSHLLQEAIKNDALLFASYNLCQKCSLDSLKKNNPFQTIKIPTLRPSNIQVQRLKAPSLSLSFPDAK